MRLPYHRLAWLACLMAVGAPFSTYAGGGGQNMLLVVNPNSEASLRIANAYAEARGIPSNNIVFIAPPTRVGYPHFTTDTTSFTNIYVNGLASTITARGLDSQIDYIGTIGQPQTIGGSYKNASNVSVSTKLAVNAALSQLTQLQRGMYYGAANSGPGTVMPYFTTDNLGLVWRKGELLQSPPPSSGTWSYVTGSNTAIHHSTQYTIPSSVVKPPGYSYAQWYMSGNVGNAGMFALTTEQIIANLQYTIAGDGTKPAGRVYFMDSGDSLRTGPRKATWPAVQSYMTAHGIPWIEEAGVSGSTPKNRTDVRGAVIGAANPVLSNGSVYLPGSYVDNLTSNSGGYGSNSQVKADKFLLTGAGATAGTISEPYSYQDRFTYGSVFVFSNDGSTLGEAHYKSVIRPDYDMFEGDLLSQAYADVPRVTFNTAPAKNAIVSGAVNIGATGVLVGPLTTTATAISKLQLYVDGTDKGTISAATGTFNLNTTQLSDGYHEFRVVAYNNSAAEVQGFASSSILVNNSGRTATVAGTTFQAAWNDSLAIPITGTAGGGTILRMELQSLGRTVGQLNAASGDISLDATKLAFGKNTLIPVAIMADGSKVQGVPFTVNRDFHRLAGAAAAPVASRTAGFKYEYFANTAGHTIVETNFTGTPTIVQQGTILDIDANEATAPALRNMPDAFRYATGGSNVGLAVRASSKMLVTLEGEYSFWFTTQGSKWDSLQFSVDGFPLMSHEYWTGTKFDSQGVASFSVDTTQSIYLQPGEHSLQILLAGFEGSGADGNNIFSFWYRGPDGVSQQPTTAAQSTGATFYTVASLAAGSGTWKNGSGDSLWTTNTTSNSNWSTAYPSATGQIATFADAANGGTTPGSVNLNGSKTVGGLIFNTATQGYTLGTPGTPDTLTLQVATGLASVTVAGGATHTINARVIVASNTTVSVAGGASLRFAGGVQNSASTLELSGAGTVAANDVINTGTMNLSGGSKSLGSIDGATGTSSGQLSASGTTTLLGDVQVTALRIRQNTVNVGDATSTTGATLIIQESLPGASTGTPSGNDTYVSIVKTLAIFNSGGYKGTLDLRNNDLIIDYTGSTSPLPAVEAMVKSGYNGGTWTGKGVTSSIAAGDIGAYSLAVLDNALRPTPFATFDGITVPTTVVIVKLSWVADLDLDGVVTSNDGIVFANNYSEGASATHRVGDLNYNGIFDSSDAILFANAYNETLPHLPEPGTLTVLALGIMGLLKRRQR